MAKLLQPPPKFTHPEWVISNQYKYANAEGERAAAERLVDESKRLIDETDKTTYKTQRDVNKKFDQRIFDTKYWEKELDDKLEGIKSENEYLNAYKTRFEKAIDACKEPLHIAQQCLVNRQRRKGIDLVHDDAERELIKEVEVIQGVLALLERTWEQAKEQMRLNRKAIYNVEKDLKDKFAALRIDEHNAELKNNSAGISFKSGVAHIDPRSVTEDQWQDFSNKNILDTEKQRQNSENLRSLMDGILQAVANDMNRQKENTDIALAKRIAETRDAKDKLEAHVAKVKGQIIEMEDNIDRLRNAVAAKEDPLKLAETRLDNRQYRPNVELCRDPVQFRLVEEVGQIETNIARLQQRLGQTLESLKGLERRKLELEDEIAIKENTLRIDEAECQALRKSIHIQAY